MVVEQPTYFLVTPIFRDNHLTVVPVPTDEHGMVVDELERWLRADPSHRWALGWMGWRMWVKVKVRVRVRVQS